MKDCRFKMKIPDKKSYPDYNIWKYGAHNMPSYLKRPLVDVKSAYAKADVHYMVGELDSDKDKGTAYKLLDKSCAAQLQGRYRLQRVFTFLPITAH